MLYSLANGGAAYGGPVSVPVPAVPYCFPDTRTSICLRWVKRRAISRLSSGSSGMTRGNSSRTLKKIVTRVRPGGNEYVHPPWTERIPGKFRKCGGGFH